MAYLESTATLAQVLAQYETTSVYDIEVDLVMCREQIQACRMLIARTADETRQGSAALRDNAGKYERALKAATNWLASRDAAFAGDQGAGTVRVLSLDGLRYL